MAEAGGCVPPERIEGAGRRWALDLDRFLEVAAVFTIATGLIGLGTVLLGKFEAFPVTLSGLLLAIAYALLLRSHSTSAVSPRWRDLACLVAVALCFRLPAYNYVLGGQDEGLYVNIANTIERTGGLNIQDAVGEKLRGSTQFDTYKKSNRSTYVLEGKTYPDYMAGIYLNGAKGYLEFQFYHLLPVWIALFGGILGQQYGVYALTFLALISISFMYRFALVLTASRKAALAAGLLLALSPLHAFFSKFPVTEVPALAFSAIGFTYVAAFFCAEESARRKFWLYLSAAALGCLFLTRISGFMYIAFIAAFAVAALAGDQDRSRGCAINGWAVAVVALYAVSVIYGFRYSPHYSSDIYRLSFDPFFGNAWKAGMILLACCGLTIWAGIAWIARPGRSIRDGHWLIEPARWMAGPLMIAALMFGAWKIYRLGWTDQFDASPLKTLAHLEWRSAEASSLVQLMIYTGPMLLLFIPMAWKPRREPALECLRIFVIGFLAYVATLQWILPYGPYYARYLLSELAPYMMVFVVVIWWKTPAGARRSALSATLAATVAYSGATAAAQIGKQENAGLYASLENLVNGINPTDLVLLESKDSGVPNTSELKTTLVYTFGENVAAVDSAALADTRYIAMLDSLYGRVFLITPKSRESNDYRLLRSEQVDVWAFRPTHFWPRQLVKREAMHLSVFQLRTVEKK